jgi:hypothetical protein
VAEEDVVMEAVGVVMEAEETEVAEAVVVANLFAFKRYKFQKVTSTFAAVFSGPVEN